MHIIPNGIRRAIKDTIILADARGDNQQYTIRKMEDNKCWVTDNLKLGSTQGEMELTYDNTDLAENTTYTLPQVGGT